jgi:hypothetical protein
VRSVLVDSVRSDARSEEQTATRVDALPGDPARRFPGEERDDVRDIAGPAEAVESRRPGDVVGQGLMMPRPARPASSA